MNKAIQDYCNRCSKHDRCGYVARNLEDRCYEARIYEEGYEQAVEDNILSDKAIYLIAYDIHEQQYDYTHLKGAIMSYEDYQHPMESVWFVCVLGGTTADDIYAKLKPYLRSKNDRLYIVEQTRQARRSGWIQKTMWRWMNKRLNCNKED